MYLTSNWGWGGGGVGVLVIMNCTGRICPKGVPYSGWSYIKGQGFQAEIQKRVGELPFRFQQILNRPTKDM